MRGLKAKAFAAVFILLLLGFLAQHAQAAKGIPGSQEFSFGAVLYAASEEPAMGLSLAEELKPDWLYVPVSWSETFPKPGEADLTALDRVMAQAAKHQTPVAFGLTSAPEWALTPQGPNPDLATQVSLFLAKRYPGQLQAIELFPRANTSQGWGSSPDPAAYLNLLRSVRRVFMAEGQNVVFIAAGLQPVSSTSTTGNMNDLDFLQGLYDAGGKDWMPVVSLQFVELTGEPLASPSQVEYRTLRHYEQVRKVMVTNKHLSGLIWITHLRVPSGQIDPADAAYLDQGKQADWLQKAYVQLRSQLYIGAAFLVSLNAQDNQPGMTSMSMRGGARHPFFMAFKDLVYQNNKSNWVEKPGRPKNGQLDKLRE